MITALEHVGLSVADLGRSIAFYRDILGFAVVRVLEVPPAMRLGDVVGLPPCTARIAHLTLGPAMLELFEYRDPQGRPISGRPVARRPRLQPHRAHVDRRAR